jgi:hypothetical protein
MFIGCATTGGDVAFYAAQKEYMLAQANQTQKPLFELKAVEGKAVENLASVTFYMPNLQQAKDFKQFVAAPHPGWETANTTIRTLGILGGYYFIADGVKSIFNAAMSWAGSHNTTISTTGNNNKTQITGDMSISASMGAGDDGTIAIDTPSLIYDGSDNTHAPTIMEPRDPVIVQQPAPVIVQPSYPPTD